MVNIQYIISKPGQSFMWLQISLNIYEIYLLNFHDHNNIHIRVLRVNLFSSGIK